LKNKDELLNEIEIYKKAREREKNARLQADQLLEEKTRELYLAHQELTQKYQELEKHASELELFQSLSRISQGTQTLNEVLQFLVDAICKLEKWPVGHVFLLKEGADKELVPSDIWYFDSEKDYHELHKITSDMHFEIGESLPGITLATEEPLYIEDVQNDSNYFRAKVCKNLGIRGTFCVPLKCNNKVLAIVEFFIPETHEEPTKGFSLINSFVRQLETLLERQQAQEQARESSLKLQQALVEVQQMAHHDPLTNLPNRRQFELTLKRNIASAKRYHKNLALLFVDLDNFKSINDRLGHDVGDLLLIEVGRRLQANVRTEDFVARIGGDEFAITLDSTAMEEAEVVAEKLIRSLKDPFKIANHDIIVSISIGISSFPESGSDYITLHKNADIAMYKAKELGRDNYKRFDITLETQYKKQLDIENDIDFALEKNEFFLVYQPIYDLLTKKIFGMEVLLRWQNDEHGLILPEEFIPIAEERGTIIPIGEWVLKEACIQYMKWRNEIKLDCKLLINISPRQLKDKSFLNSVVKITNETQMPLDKLEFEVTEAVLMSSPEESEDVLKKLSDLGIKIAIDDFGMGYSSLNRLKSLPISSLKIDKSFIQDIGTQGSNDLIVKSIIALAKELHIQMIAEGIEAKSQLNFLLDQNCPEGQGYYFAHPLTKNEMKKAFLENAGQFSDSSTPPKS